MNDNRPTVLLALAEGADAGPWTSALADALPGFAVVTPELAVPAAVRYVAAWKHPPGSLADYPAVKAIFSLGAGVDHLLSDVALPPGVPLIRVVDPDLTNRMSEWVVLHVLLHHRQQRLYDYQQFETIWADDRLQPAARDVRVGVMGLGTLGSDAARKLKMLGFDVAGWSLRPKTIEGIPTFAGKAERAAFLARTQMLVVLLPLTPQTQGILDADLLASLARDGHPGGAILLNAGRGGLQNEADILAALDEGILRAVRDARCVRTRTAAGDLAFVAPPRGDDHPAQRIDFRPTGDRAFHRRRDRGAGERPRVGPHGGPRGALLIGKRDVVQP